MNPFDLPPLAAVLSVAASGLESLGSLVTPALAIVLVTVAVRALLIPVGVSVAKAAQNRRRLAPQLAELQRRHRKDPQKLQRATMELYAAEKVSPLAGCLPLLAQMPVISLVYALFVLPTIAGEPNVLLTAPAFGTDLGRRLGDVFGGAMLGDLTFLALALVLMAVAWLNRRLTLRDAPAASPQLPAALDPRGPLSWAPFLTVAALAVVPLAAGLYLAVSGAWAWAERSILRRIYA
ncbi:YidC/Oxa1 family membrane protein insertase [Salinibacterium sp. ZJ77]|uniref:YidC/Oxa1 family membrane protein insertase n=1 Tax=Salinibacterium sp. ZJ77 TaxID=2708337 RepID=UPI0014248AE6|nr:YidC/Oxa1 family membrane protein insertase [Salinibacterium sp. ZJ77]